MVLWYVGITESDVIGHSRQIFTVDREEQATPEESGYDRTDGPYIDKDSLLDAYPDLDN